MEFGMSPFGCYNMAGNVNEWCANQSPPEGFVTSGGAWNDLAYSFGDYGEFPGIYSSNRIGFRCVLNMPGDQGDQGGEMLPPAETPDYKPSSDADFKVWLTHYSYDKTALNAKVTETVETNDWRRETITFAGEDGEPCDRLSLPAEQLREAAADHPICAGGRRSARIASAARFGRDVFDAADKIRAGGFYSRAERICRAPLPAELFPAG